MLSGQLAGFRWQNATDWKKKFGQFGCPSFGHIRLLPGSLREPQGMEGRGRAGGVKTKERKGWREWGREVRIQNLRLCSSSSSSSNNSNDDAAGKLASIKVGRRGSSSSSSPIWRRGGRGEKKKAQIFLDSHPTPLSFLSPPPPHSTPKKDLWKEKRSFHFPGCGDVNVNNRDAASRQRQSWRRRLRRVSHILKEKKTPLKNN